LKKWQTNNQLQIKIENEMFSKVDGRFIQMTMKIVLPSGKNLEVDYRTQEKEVKNEKLKEVKLVFRNHVFYIRSEKKNEFRRLSNWIQK
jgi:hypothetical protein